MKNIKLSMTVAADIVTTLLTVLADNRITANVQIDGIADDTALAWEPADNRGKRMITVPAVVDADLRREPFIADLVAQLTNGQSNRAMRPSSRTNEIEQPRKPKTLYAFTRKADARKIATMDLTPHMRKVLAYVIGRKRPASRDEIADATGIGRKSVESPIYMLRSTRPALLESVSAEK